MPATLVSCLSSSIELPKGCLLGKFTAICASDQASCEIDLETGETIRVFHGAAMPKGCYGMGMYLDATEHLLYHSREGTELFVTDISNGRQLIDEPDHRLEMGTKLAGAFVDDNRQQLVVQAADGDLMALPVGGPMMKSARKR